MARRALRSSLRRRQGLVTDTYSTLGLILTERDFNDSPDLLLGGQGAEEMLQDSGTRVVTAPSARVPWAPAAQTALMGPAAQFCPPLPQSGGNW